MDDITHFLVRSREVVQAALDSPAFIAACGAIVDCLEACFRSDRKLLIAGNGGSAGDAQHIASEFLSRLNVDRAPLPAFALTTDTSVLTAISNDYGYDRSFERQIRGLGRPGDVFIAISTSGRSPNILRAMAAARERGLTVVAFTGRDGGGMPALSDLALRVPSESTPLIQQLHITAAHIICGLVEARMFPDAASRTGTESGCRASRGAVSEPPPNHR